MYLRPPSRKLVVAFPVLAALALAGCGGGGAPQSEQRIVRGAGFRFLAPADWRETRLARQVSISPQPRADDLVSVTVFRLLKPFRPALWPRVVGELDRTAGELARGLGGRVESSKTVRVGGLRAREYELAYRRGGRDLRNRIVFALQRRTEYQLLCRWLASDDEPEACGLLLQSFRPA